MKQTLNRHGTKAQNLHFLSNLCKINEHMRNLNPKMLYWIFLVVLIVGLVSTFWFNVFLSPLLAILFFVTLNFSFPSTLFFAIFYGIFFDISSGAPFGQYTLGFVALCATIFIFRKFFALRNNVVIFLLCLTVSLVFYILSLSTSFEKIF